MGIRQKIGGIVKKAGMPRGRFWMKKGSGGVAFLVILGGMFLLSAALLAALSAIMLKNGMGAGFISGGVIAAYVISCLVGGFCMGQFMGKHKFIWGILIGVCYFGILFLAGRAIYHTGIKADIQFISSFMICMVAGMLGGMLAPRVRN